jgi:transcriptional regulator
LVASHYPILLDDEAEGLTVRTHVGRPDDVIH